MDHRSKSLSPESLRYILGLKVRHARQAKKLGLKELSKASGLSVSYLSEIEKGRKYPKPDKILALARALEEPFEDLVSPRMDDALDPVSQLFSSPFLAEFPFHLFGLEPESIVQLVTDVPVKAGALLRSVLEIGRTYDLRVEHFLFSALRSYQQLHRNHFDSIEEAAAGWLDERGWIGRAVLPEAELQAVLESEHGYRIAPLDLERYPELAGLRSVWVPRDDGGASLYVNPRLRSSQRAFALGRELGYKVLGLTERSETSIYLRVRSFDQVIHDFEAAYFSGALLIQKDHLVAELGSFFARETFSADAFLELLGRYETTPETFFYRLSQVLPAVFGFEELAFVRFSHAAGSGRFRLTKLLNMTKLPIPLGMEPSEHYCRRWPGPSLLQAAVPRPAGASDLTVASQRSRFQKNGDEYLTLTLARPLSLVDGASSSVSVLFRLDEAAKSRVAFADDPAIPFREVDLTCERCPLTDCAERAAPPEVREASAERRSREAAVERLAAESL